MNPLRRNLFSVVLLLVTLGALANPHPAEAAGIGDYVTAPLNSVASVFEGALGALASIFMPHGAVASLPSTENAAALVYVPVPTSTPQTTPVATTTIIYKYVTAPSSPALTITSGGVSQAELNQKLQELDDALQSQIAAITSGGPLMGQGGLYNEIAASNKVDQLSGVTITNSTIDAASIPNLAGTYLPLTGGTVSGTLSVASNDFIVGTDQLVASGNNIGIGTSSPGQLLSVAGNGYLTGGIEVGNPTGGMPGSGIINAQGVEINGNAVGPFLAAGVASVTVVDPGAGYVPATSPDIPDTITLSGGTYTTPAQVYVTSTQVVAASVSAGGSGCTDGTQTVTGTSVESGWADQSTDPGWSFAQPEAFQASVTVSGGTITAVNSITVPGIYYSNPSSLTAEPVTGAGCSGATLSLTMGVLTAGILNPGSYSAVSGTTETLTQASTTGSGSGVTLTATFQHLGVSSPVLTPIDNTIIGIGAAPNATGDMDVYIGYNAGHFKTCGTQNVFVGAEAGVSQTCSGTYPDDGEQTFVGARAGFGDTTGLGNTFIGQRAGENDTTGANNVFMGAHAGIGNISGIGDVYLGSFAGGDASSTGDNNIGIGNDAALYLGGTGGYDVIMGFNAGQGTSGAPNTGQDNVIIGSQSGQMMTSGSQDTLLGFEAGMNAGSGSSNVYLGYLSGQFNNGGENIFIGPNAGQAITGSSRNIFIGSDAGNTVPNNTQNMFVAGNSGYERIDNVYFGSGYAAASSTSYTIHGTGGLGANSSGADLILAGGTGVGSGAGGNLIFQTAPVGSSGTATSTLVERMRITDNGDIAIGTTTPYSPLEVWGPDTATTTAFDVVNNASTTAFAVYDNGNATYSGSLFQSSDERLKTDVTSLNASSSLAEVEALNPVSYLRIDQPSSGENLGFLAQQAGSVFPELVSTTSATALTPGGTLTLNYVGLIAPIVKSIQALAGEVTALQQTVGGFAQAITTNILTASEGHFTTELCVGTTCIDQQQLAALLANEGQEITLTTPTVSVSTSTSSTSTPPVLSVNGNNPAEVEVGSTYSDLGATITGPSGDLNLGVQALVDGGATTSVSQISIDTSSVATHTIEYFAIDQNGLMGTATRTVVVYDPNTSLSTTTATSTSTSTATSTGQ